MLENSSLTQSTLNVVAKVEQCVGVTRTQLSNGATVCDMGVKSRGSLEAGRLLAEICLAGRGEVSITQSTVDGIGWPQVEVRTDSPVEACLLSQYAGWRVSVDKFFGMGSGPMRAVAAREELYQKLDYREKVYSIIGVLEAGQLPDAAVAEYIANRCGMSAPSVTLFVAPTASLAGSIQVVARSVETAMHKLFELGFDIRRVCHGFGSAPLPPVAKNDLAGIGRTNDAILYGGRVTLWVTGDDETLKEIGPKVPASAAQGYGRPFLEVFEEAGRDFYKIDPMLFSPGEIVFHNITTGNAFQFGGVNPQVLRKSFGV